MMHAFFCAIILVTGAHRVISSPMIPLHSAVYTIAAASVNVLHVFNDSSSFIVHMRENIGTQNIANSIRKKHRNSGTQLLLLVNNNNDKCLATHNQNT